MIDELLPEDVVVVEAFDDDEQDALFSEEERYIARSVDKRRREFTTVRTCARRALSKLGIPPAPILPGERGAPQWPSGIVGSLTHCDGYRAAAVAHATRVLSLGIDAEPHDVLPEGVLDQIARPEELAHLAELTAAAPGIHWDRLLFSAKESIYKTWFPQTRRWLGFEDATVTFTPRDATFTAALHIADAPSSLSHLSGRWLARPDLVATAIALPR